jgi:ribonuclease HII
VSVISIDIFCVSNLSIVICGVDEAGKGAVLGPMVVAGVACKDAAFCEGRGWRDSKLLTPARREVLYEEIRSACRVSVVCISSAEIDTLRTETGMNEIVARAHARVISALQPARGYVDACDVNARRYGERVTAHLTHPCAVIAEHKADRTYPIVAAASIVAKVTRDRAISGLRDEYGDLGSGYPSDATTLAFLETYIRERGSPPACARRSWKTVGYILERQMQKTLFDF